MGTGGLYRTLLCLLLSTLSGGCALQILGEPKENRKLAAEIILQNPLPEPLENCCFSIEGANLTGGRVISERLYDSLEIIFLNIGDAW